MEETINKIPLGKDGLQQKIEQAFCDHLSIDIFMFDNYLYYLMPNKDIDWTITERGFQYFYEDVDYESETGTIYYFFVDDVIKGLKKFGKFSKKYYSTYGDIKEIMEKHTHSRKALFE